MGNGASTLTPFSLHSLCATGHLQLLTELVLSLQVDLNITDAEGMTGIAHAAARGHVDCVRVLLESRADFTIGDSFGKSDLF